MTNLTLQSPLMQPIEYQGQSYFTSQYFHQQYLANSHAAGKYRRHDNFLRVLRSIEAYSLYLAQCDVIELGWQSLKVEGTQNLSSWQPLFQAAGWNPLTLLNATAQIALSHHLDDEISKQVSVAANTTVARQAQHRVRGQLPEEVAERKLAAFLRIGRLLHTPEHIVQQEAVKEIEVSTGLNLCPLLIAAPSQDHIDRDDKMLEPNDLAKELNLPSGYRLNLALEQIGWQVKKIGGDWEPTPAGTPHATPHAWVAERGSKTGYYYKWRVFTVRAALERAGICTPAPEGEAKP